MPYISKRVRRLTLLFRLISYFILIFMITTVMSSYFTYNHFSSSFKDEIMEYNSRVLNQMSIFSDEFILKNVNELVTGLALQNSNESIISRFLSSDPSFDENKWVNMLNVRNQLDSIIFRNRDIVDSVFIYSKDRNILASQKLIRNISVKEAASDEEFRWIYDMSKSNDSILWLKTRSTRLYSDEAKSSGDIITVICTYPLCSVPDEAKGYLAVNINEKAINKYLVKFNSNNLGQMIILDNTGSTISHSRNTDLYRNISGESFVKRILISDTSESFRCMYDGEENVVSFIKSKYNSWYYVSLVPTKLFYQKDYYIKNRLLMASAIMLIIVLALSVFLSYSLYSPFKKILNKYMPSLMNSFAVNQSSQHNCNEYGLLDNAFRNMSDEICSLQDILHRNLQMMRNNFFSDLMYKRISSAEGVKEMLSTLNLVLDNKYFNAAVFSICRHENTANQETDIQLARYNIIEYIKSLSNDYCRLIPIDTNSTVISAVINSADDDPELIKQLAFQISDFCRSNFSFNMTASTGKYVTNILDIGNSYTEARIAAQYRFIKPETNVFCYTDILEKSTNTLPIPEDLADKLDKYLKLSNLSGVKEILEKFCSAASGECMNYKAVRKEITNYLNILEQYLESAGIDYEKDFEDALMKRLKHPASMLEFSENFINAAELSFSIISGRKQNRNSELVNSVERYILSNIQLDLSLSTVSETFNISSQHLSKIFKEEKGVNFIDYVVICKIEKAKNLLAATNMSINDITEKTGYSHATYLARKFKELTGMTPSEYRRHSRQKLY